ncbi:MAG: MogA/MoaB family molybdenum cofactor biosynthesis protein [Candidatus Caldarchaeum sp.]|nr:MogA/MoaB family molybdenum cofactor biosynthesis protein [Candidatus Caldarchaeum sp.]
MAVLTASTSRYNKKVRGEPYTDESGEKAVQTLKDFGHDVEYLGVVNDDVWMIRTSVTKALELGFDVVVISGGTGLSPRDVTIEALRPLFEKEVEGWGEVFRMLSYQEVGPAAALSRTTAGVIDGKLVVALPGSPSAVELGLKTLAPEMPHIVHIIRGQ